MMDSSRGKQMADTTKTDSDTPRLITGEQLWEVLAQIETVTGPLLDAVTSADTRERQIQSLREVIARVHQDASRFRSQRDELLEALERMRPEYLELESKVDFLESKLRLKDQTIAQLRSTRFFQRHEIKMLEKQIRSAHREHEEFQLVAKEKLAAVMRIFQNTTTELGEASQAPTEDPEEDSEENPEKSPRMDSGED